MEWSREKTVHLISEYRKRRGLWDMTCDEYRKKDVKHRLLNEVSKSLGGNISIQELEKKFHTLRTQYHREINRMKRKEPYNSKWFGFKHLEFLSSPYACRSVKGRVKTELQIEGNSASQKYLLGEISTTSATTTTSTTSTTTSENNNNGSTAAGSGSNMADEYLPTSKAQATRRELEKLIEETTKDVDEIDEPETVDDVEAKPKLIKEQQTATYEQLHESEEAEPLESPPHQQHLMEIHQHPTSGTVEAVSFQANESGELHYQSSPTAGSVSGASTMHVVPTRIFKIQRRDTNQEEGYFEDSHMHPPAPKRIYYDPSGGTHSATLLTASSNANGSANVLTNTLATTGTLRLPRVVNTTTISPPKPDRFSPTPAPSPAAVARDEFATYGEYVANELRSIRNREALIALKHKINTAIFEANMAELQK